MASDDRPLDLTLGDRAGRGAPDPASAPRGAGFSRSDPALCIAARDHPGMTGCGAPPDDDWAPWPPSELARRLSAISLPWCVVGGWALDLWHGRQTRDHDDLEITILREDFSLFRQALADMTFYTVDDGRFERLPQDEEPPPHIAQIWCFDASAGRWRVDLMIEPGERDLWVCKRCPAIRRPRAEMVAVTPDRIPYLRPAAVLLFKAKHRRDKDQADFVRALPHLPQAERLWLRDCLDRLHPGHVWLQAL